MNLFDSDYDMTGKVRVHEKNSAAIACQSKRRDAISLFCTIAAIARYSAAKHI